MLRDDLHMVQLIPRPAHHVSHPIPASSIYYDPSHPPCSIFVPGSVIPQSLFKFSLVYLMA